MELHQYQRGAEVLQLHLELTPVDMGKFRFSSQNSVLPWQQSRHEQCHRMKGEMLWSREGKKPPGASGDAWGREEQLLGRRARTDLVQIQVWVWEGRAAGGQQEGIPVREKSWEVGARSGRQGGRKSLFLWLTISWVVLS